MEVKRTLRSRRKIAVAVFFAAILAGVGITFAVHNDWTVYNNSISLSDGQRDYFVEEVCEKTDWQPGEECKKEATYTNQGSNTMLVRMSYEEFWKNAGNTGILPLTYDDGGVEKSYATVRLQNQADWTLADDGWYYYKAPVQPNETTSSLLKSVYLNDDTNLGTDNTCTETQSGMVCNNDSSDTYSGAHYHVYVVFQTCAVIDEGESCFGEAEDYFYHITVMPNGGEFNGSASNYVDLLPKNTVVDLSNISRSGYNFRDWTKNNTSSYTASTITMTEDVTLVANWVDQGATSYTVTVDPNGGEYAGTTAVSTYTVLGGDYFYIGEATYADHLLRNWINDGTDAVITSPFVVNSDITIKAIWDPIVARNERTGKLYPSITAAQAEVKTNFADSSLTCEERNARNTDVCDTVTLLIDTNEEVVNDTKKYILNLDGHTVTGSLTNNANGDIILLDGEINNPNGTAVTNNGILTLGVDDYDNNGAAMIDNNYVRIVGSTLGLDQRNKLNYYDGYIEGLMAMTGGAQKTPKYHDVFDDRDVQYYPLVTSYNEGTDAYYQHAQLAAVDNAVSKTIVNGEVYYYNLQDNIKASAVSGYDIYAVRSFPASYELDVPANKTINFDLYGYNVSFANTTTIEEGATFNITNNKKPGVNSGILVTQKEIYNNGTLNLTDVALQDITTLPAIATAGDINLTRSTVAAGDANAIQATNGNSMTITMDSSSSISSSSTTKYTIDAQQNTSLTINGGTVNGTRGITTYGILYLNDMTLNASTTGTANGTVVISNSTINVISTDSSVTVTGIDRGAITLKNGSKLNVTGAGRYFYGIDTSTSVNIIENSKLSFTSTYATSTDGYLMGINCRNGCSQGIVIKDSAITINGYQMRNVDGITSLSSDFLFENSTLNMYGGSYYSGRRYNGLTASNGEMKSGTVTVKCTSTDRYLANCTSWGATLGTNFVLSGGTITGGTDGVVTFSSQTTTIAGGTVTGIIGNGARGTPIIVGGTVKGGQYGVYASGGAATIGDNSDAINIDSPQIIGEQYGVALANDSTTFSSLRFYDGTITGYYGAIYNNSVTETTDGAIIHYEGSLPQKAWLVIDDNYLQVGETEYNSLIEAYNAAGNGGTIKVIKDNTTAAPMPSNPSDSTITLDLNGHTVTYASSFVNAGTLNVVDNSGTNAGVLNNNGSIIYYSGSYPYNSIATILLNGQDAKLNITNAEVSSTSIAIRGEGRKETIQTTNAKITGNKIGMFLERSYAVVTMTDSIFEVTGNSTDTTYGVYVSSSSYSPSITLNGNSQYIVRNGATVYGLYTYNGNAASGTITANGNSKVTVTGDSSSTAVQGSSGTIRLRDSAQLTVTSTTGSVTGAGQLFASDYSKANISSDSGVAKGTTDLLGITSANSVVTVSSRTGNAFGEYISGSYSGYTNIYGTLNVSGKNAYGLYNMNGYIFVYGGAKITATASNGTGYGLYVSANTPTTVYGGTITGSSYGIYNSSSSNPSVTVTGGTITGGTDGIYKVNLTIGNNDGNISIHSPVIQGTTRYGVEAGKVNFYDGVLKGKTNAYQAGIINSIAPSSDYHIETISGLENCWLVSAQDYLEVNGSTFNSLDDAYNAAASGDTVKVIANAFVEATLPANPSGKTIYFDLNGHELTYKQPLINEGTMTILDSSTEKTGTIINNNTANTVGNTGTLNITSGTIVGDIPINNSKDLNMSGGAIAATTQAIGGNTLSTVVMTGGSISVSDCATYGIYANSVTIGGDSTIETTGSGTAVYAFASATVEDDAAITVNGNGRGINTATFTMNDDSSLIVNGNGIGAYIRGNATINDNSIIRVIGNSESGTSVGISFDGTVTGLDHPTIAINGGQIEVSGGYTRGVRFHSSASSWYYYDWGEPTLIVDGGTITATTLSSDKTRSQAVSVLNACEINLNIIDGSLTGDGYGIYVSDNVAIVDNYCSDKATVTLGEDDATVGSSSPIVSGGAYGMYGTRVVYFYDGKILGGVSAYQYDEDIVEIADNYAIYVDSETVGGETYEARYLTAKYDVAKIGNTKYTSLEDAIDAAGTNDTIVLLENITLFQTLTIPDTKKFTLDTNGKSIATNKTIVNEGDVSIVNNSGNDMLLSLRKLDQSSTDNHVYYFENKSGAKLQLTGIRMESYYGIKNYGEATIDGATIVSESSSIISGSSSSSISTTKFGQAIENYGAVTIRNQSDLYAYGLTVYNGRRGSTANIDDSSLGNAKKSDAIYQYQGTQTDIANSTINGSINNLEGTISLSDNTTVNSQTVSPAGNKPMINNSDVFEIEDSILVYDDDADYSNNTTTRNSIRNNVNGSMSISSTSISAAIRNPASGYSYTINSINNSGTLTLSDSTTVSAQVVCPSQYNNRSNHINGIINAGQLTYEDTSLTIPACGYYGAHIKGIDNSGNMDFVSGSVNVATISGDNRGIYNSGTADITAGSATVTSTDSNYNYGIQNYSGTLNIDNMTISSVTDSGISYGIYNKDDNTISDVTVTSTAGSGTSYGYYNNGGETSVTNISLSSASTSGDSYAIYSESGELTVLDGDMSATGVNTYGAFIQSGEVTLGEAEPSDSPDYGEATAHVSTTSPAVSSIGSTSGIGVKNATGGTFNFYDGRITANTKVLPEAPSAVEYLYEMKEYTNVSGHKYVILEWIRPTPPSGS